MSCGSKSIILANDLELTSQRDGSAEIYWLPANPQGEFSGARGLRLRLDVLKLDGDATVEVLGQWSIDGRTWHDFARAVTEDLISAVGTFDSVYVGDPTEFGPLVRIGIQVTGDTAAPTNQGRARLSAEVQTLGFPMADSFVLDRVFSVTAGMPETVVGAARTFISLKQATAYVIVTGFSGANSITFKLQHSPDGVTWFDDPSVLTFTADGKSYQTFTDLGWQVRLVCSSGASTTATAEVHMVVKEF